MWAFPWCSSKKASCPPSLPECGGSPAVNPLRVDVAGGGPVGLTFAILLGLFLGRRVQLRVYDRRWCQHGGGIAWRGPKEGSNRRRQVVTLQSNVWSRLPGPMQQRLFRDGQYAEVWPFGPDSPADRGRPRNVRIRWVEDCLLEMAQGLGGIELVPGAYAPPANCDGLHVLAVCDGQASATRHSLREYFGTPSREPYSVNGSPLEEIVLGLEVHSDLPDEYTVPLTVAQTRFLFNPLFGGGFINMRLSPEEAAEVVGIGDGRPVDCIQSNPCVMHRGARGFACETHGTVFKPSVDPHSFLWPRIQDGLRYFGVAPDKLLAVTAFRLGMQDNPRFTAQLGPGTFGCLLGDAACALHFWPGRGLNTGLKSALALARCLRRQWQGAPLRLSAFQNFEGFMRGLCFRETGRAWAAMKIAGPDGALRGIAERIRAGLTPPFPREALKAEMFARIKAVKDRLAGRMGALPDDDWYMQRLIGLSDPELKVMAESGPWITKEVGGPEVSVDDAFPPGPGD
jgi:hypothetical protein